VSTSGVSTFSLNANQIIEKAFNRIGVGTEGEALTARYYQDGLLSLNLLIKALGAADHLWIRTERSVTLVAGQAAYTLTPKPLRVLSVRRRATYGSDVTDIPMSEMSRQEYYDQPIKTTSPSTPVSWHYEPGTSTGTLYVWPAPASSIIASHGLQVTYLRRMDDMVSANDDLDMPQEWLQAVIWNLADDLSTEYPITDPYLAAKVTKKAADTLAQAKGFDNETASLFLQPEAEEWR
jgi:hypothetical protein